MSCKTCINYGIYEMITGGKPYGYSGNIPCNRCSRYRTFEDLYVENTLSKSSVVSEQTEFLERVSKKSKEMLAIMEKHNIVIDDLDNKMQKFAFTAYSELVQLSQEAKNLLES